MGCGASSLTRVEDYVPADDVSAGCVSHVSDQHLDDTDIASLPSQKSVGEEATERPSLLKMKVAARVLHARVRYGINDDPNQFEDEWKIERAQSARKQMAVAQFIDDHVQSIVRLELEEEVAYESLDDVTDTPGLSPSASILSSPRGKQLIISAHEFDEAGETVDLRSVPKPTLCDHELLSSHFHLPPATLRGHLDYDLLAMAVELERANTLPLGRFLKHKRRAIRQLSEVLSQRERCNPPLANQLRLAIAHYSPCVVASAPLRLTSHILFELGLAYKKMQPGLLEGLHVRWIVSGRSHLQRDIEADATAMYRSTSLLD